MTDLQSKRSTLLAGARRSSQVLLIQVRLQVSGLRFASFQIPSPPEDIFGSLASEKAKGSASGGRTSGRAGRGSIARALTVPVGSRPSHGTAGVPSVKGPSVGDLIYISPRRRLSVRPLPAGFSDSRPEEGVARAVVVEASLLRESIRERGRAVGSDRIARANRTGDGARAAGRSAVARRLG